MAGIHSFLVTKNSIEPMLVVFVLQFIPFYCKYK